VVSTFALRKSEEVIDSNEMLWFVKRNAHW